MSLILTFIIYVLLLTLLVIAHPELVLSERGSWQRSVGFPYAIVILAVISFYIAVFLNKAF